MSLLLEQDHVILHGVPWRTFQQLLADRGERCGVLLAYDRGTVELRVPSQEHEWVKTTLAQVVEAVAFARDLHYRSLGSTTSTAIGSASPERRWTRQGQRRRTGGQT